MHSAEALLRLFYYGFDRRSLYFRVDAEGGLARVMQSQDSLVLYLTMKAEYRVVMDSGSASTALQTRSDGQWSDTGISCRCALKKIGEIEVPLEPLNLSAGDYVFVSLVHLRGGNELGRWPTDAPMKLLYAGGELELDTWLI
jgi:hypothetical protein